MSDKNTKYASEERSGITIGEYQSLKESIDFLKQKIAKLK
jgi:hypothetical protein